MTCYCGCLATTAVFKIIAYGGIVDGKTIKQHPAYEQVFQPVFSADEKSVAYGVKDGNKLIWKVEKLGE